MTKLLNINREYVFAGFLLLVGVAVRVWQFPNMPPGLNQDEASIGYDAFALLHYGADRNGYANPVYLMSWGSGQNALYAYLSMPFIWFFGLNELSVRLVSLIFGIASLPLFYLTVRKLTEKEAALTALLLLTVSPWHIMISRWGLEANLLPAVFLIAVYLFVLASERKSTALFCVSAAVFALSMYAYSAVTIVLPVFMAALCIYSVKKQFLTLRQLLFAGACFLVVSVPMALFYFVNLFGLDEITTGFFSVPRFTALRSSAEGFDILGFLRFLVVQDDGLPWNVISGYGIYYLPLIPFTVLGIVCAFLKRSSAIMNLWLTCGLLLGCIVQYNINRVNFLWIPMIYLTSVGLHFILTEARFLRFVLIPAIAIFFAFFASSYFGDDYRNTMEHSFNEGFGEVITAAAREDADRVHVSRNIHGAYALTLFYTQPDPRDFYTTVVYTDPNWEFRFVESFDKYVFTVPNAIDPSSNGVYIVKVWENVNFDDNYHVMENYGQFSLIKRR